MTVLDHAVPQSAVPEAFLHAACRVLLAAEGDLQTLIDALGELEEMVEAADPGLLGEVRWQMAQEIDPSRTAGVYFVRAGAVVKVGTSQDVRARLRTLQTGCPEPLQLLAVMRGGRAEEAEVHRLFDYLRIHGEWFRAEPELMRFIASLEER